MIHPFLSFRVKHRKGFTGVHCRTRLVRDLIRSTPAMQDPPRADTPTVALRAVHVRESQKLERRDRPNGRHWRNRSTAPSQLGNRSAENGNPGSRAQRQSRAIAAVVGLYHARLTGRTAASSTAVPLAAQAWNGRQSSKARRKRPSA